MIAAKLMDPVVGVDIHIIQPPGPVPPLPIPHPFIGMVFDPMEMVPIVGATVMVNGMPCATAGTACKNIPPHIPIGGMFVKPPGNEGEVFMGSATVLADGTPFSFMAVPVLSCSDVGMPPPPRMSKKSKAKSLLLPTTVLMAIPMGMPVMVGGPPTIDMMGMAIKAGMSALGKGMKKLRKMQKSSKTMKKVSQKLNKAADKVLGKEGKARNAVRRGICFATGHPVDIATGKVFTDHTDFAISGPIPFVWERVWYSTSTYEGPLGHGWHHSYDMKLTQYPHEEMMMLQLTDGRYTPFPTLAVGESFFNRSERMTLFRDEKGYVIKDHNNLSYRFENRNPYEPLDSQLVSMGNTSGLQLIFQYNAQGRLEHITDSAGRVFELTYNEQGRITIIHAPHPDHEDETFPIVQYVYDEFGNLTQVKDALAHSFYYEYQYHLLVKETNRNGLSFYFEYDGADQRAKCVRTWGDGGIYDHKLTYAEDITFVENSLGHTSENHHNSALVTKQVDPKGNAKYYVYNEYNETVAEIDALGRQKAYKYDDYGNRIQTMFPDGSQISQKYDEHKLVQATDQIGGKWEWFYDELDRVVMRTDCMGNSTYYAYDEIGHVMLLTDTSGKITQYKYDDEHNLIQLTDPTRAVSNWKYDRLGRKSASIDPNRNVQRVHLNLLGDIVKIDEPDGNQRYLTYDAEGNVITARDHDSEVKFSYQGMGRIRSRNENGSQIQFLYDTEEQLIGIINEKGYEYRFDLDENGDVEIESGFDEIKRYYHRDEAGRVTSVLKVSGVEIRYKYDKLDRITEVSHWNKNREIETQYFSYREDGELLEAQNTHSHIRLERDSLGRVIKEWEGDHWIESTYDQSGLRTQLESLLGANVHFQRDIMGGTEKVSAHHNGEKWEAFFKRDIFGLETRRSFTSGTQANWKRDILGRPVQQQIFTTGSVQKVPKTRNYTWEVNYRLKGLQLNSQPPTQFGHDPFGNLAWAKYENGQYEYRNPDETGNVFKTVDKSGRQYGPAGQLLFGEGTHYQYDGEGNLINKTDSNGKKWSYHWYATGMLKQVDRPDGKSVVFTYDALGRRLSKTIAGKTTRWIWDGNNPLHEWIEENPIPIESSHQDIDTPKNKNFGIQVRSKIRIRSKTATQKQPYSYRENVLPNKGVVTWLFEPESFAPLAKFTEADTFQVITDHLGTPVVMYDSHGNTAWAAETTIYGELRQTEGKRKEMPFRYPGQYEDEETGLYYNRFRYYDPEIGGYISQDPIGLNAGIRFHRYVHDPNSWIDPLGLIIVYRNIRPDQSISDGLSARQPGRGMTPSGHIMNGSSPNFKGSQFQSTTTDPDIAARWKEPGQTTVIFDTEDVIADNKGNRSIIDVSTPEKAKNAGLKGRVYSRATSSKEVLVEGFIPADKIKKVCA